MDTDMQTLEERIAHLTRTVDDLSDMVARQDGEIRRLVARVTFLTEREAEREAEAGAPPASAPPPHW